MASTRIPSPARLVFAFALVTSFSMGTNALARGPSSPLHKLDDDTRVRRAAHDVALLRSYVTRVSRLVRDIKKSSALWEKNRDSALSPEERRHALELFEQVLAYEIGYDRISSYHANFWRLPLIGKATPHAQHFALGFASYLQQIELGLIFIDRTIGKPQFEKLLDEGNERYGIPPGAYGRLKWNVVHVLDVSRVIAAAQYHALMKRTTYGHVRKIASSPEKRDFALIINIIDSTYPFVERKLKGKGFKLFGTNGIDILKDKGHQAWFPLQAEVAEWMGDTKVHRIEDALISKSQIQSAVARTLPGDVIIQRRNWYLSNVGLPGFWPHAALWLGSPSELATFLDDDDDVRKAYGGAFTEALMKRFPQAWATYSSTDAYDHDRRILEAMSEGVVFSTAEHSLAADYAAALRPRLAKLDVARAIEHAFAYHGRPYDFDFDFFTDSSIVCSELVYKAYEPRTDVAGITFELERIMGRMTLPPNTMVRQFDAQAGTPKQQLNFVWFLDGREKSKRAIWGNEMSFRASWRRPKWDFAQK